MVNIPRAIRTREISVQTSSNATIGLELYIRQLLIDEMMHATGLKLSRIGPKGSGILFATE